MCIRDRVCDNISESSPAYSASFADDIHIFYPCASWGPAYVIGPNDPEGTDTWGLMIPPGGLSLIHILLSQSGKISCHTKGCPLVDKSILLHHSTILERRFSLFSPLTGLSLIHI